MAQFWWENAQMGEDSPVGEASAGRGLDPGTPGQNCASDM